MEDGYFDRYILRVIEFYKLRRDVMFEVFEEYMLEGVRWMKLDGGMFIWVIFFEGIDIKLMMEKVVVKGVVYVLGEVFFVYREVKNIMRFNFIYVLEEKIREGVRRFVEVIEEEIKKFK